LDCRQKNIDYAVCMALSDRTMNGLDRCLLVYDIMCQWSKHFVTRVEKTKTLSLPKDLQISKAIGDFHVRGHVPECFPRYGLSYVEGAGIIDGEVLETLWSVLNETSRSTRGASLAHRAEVLDDHMNYSNWKKMIKMGTRF